MNIEMLLLLLFDFDGTIALTFEHSPNRIGVHEAHHLSLGELFGPEVLELYHGQGGLKNQAPGELIIRLIELEPDLVRRSTELHPEKLGNQPTISELTRLFVDLKLRYLLDEICETWPRPCEGFLDFYAEISWLQSQGLQVDMGIITNGHDLFVKQTFRVWGVECPQVMVTEEDIRDLSWPSCLEDRVKPAVFPYKLAMNRWRRLRRVDHPSHVVYFGDDPHKDGGLAINAGVPFGLITEVPTDISGFPPGSFHFSDWRFVTQLLTSLVPDLARFRVAAKSAHPG